MPTLEEVQSWSGKQLVGPDEDKIGKIDHVYLDRQTGEPTFAAVKTGLFGSKSSLVPIAEAHSHDEHVHVAFSKDTVKDAPNVDADEELSEAEEQRLYEHYGQSYSAYEGPDHESFGNAQSGITGGSFGGQTSDATAGATGTTGGYVEGETRTGDVGGPGRDTSGANTDEAMTRSEEELRVGTQSRETGRARLRKYIVTEDVQTTVPVSREEVRIEREPITDANRGDAYDGPALSEEEHEVTLHAEEPVVQKDVVAKERVRLDTDTVTEDVQVNEEVRKEQIETDGDVEGGTARR